MPVIWIAIIGGGLWYFEVWPFDGKTFKPRGTAYAAEVGYYVGDQIQYEEGSRRKTLQECRSDADNIASYRGRNSPSRIVSQTCLVFINGVADHRE